MYVPGSSSSTLLAADRAFGRHALKAPAPGRDVVPLGDRLDHHEADIVAVAGIARTGITEADEEQHGMASLAVMPRKTRGMQQTARKRWLDRRPN